jgi:hypothetical protein
MRPYLVLLLALAGMSGISQAQSSAQTRSRMEIRVERRENGVWKMVDPGLVFERNDQVRFRYRANFAGYLYVVNRSTSGKVERLFPREETGQDNRIAAGKDYAIPATEAVFSHCRTGRPRVDLLAGQPHRAGKRRGTSA